MKRTKKTIELSHMREGETYWKDTVFGGKGAAFGGMNCAYPAYETMGRTAARDANADAKKAINLSDAAYANREWGNAVAATEQAIAALTRQLAAFKELKAANDAAEQEEASR